MKIHRRISAALKRRRSGRRRAPLGRRGDLHAIFEHLEERTLLAGDFYTERSAFDNDNRVSETRFIDFELYSPGTDLTDASINGVTLRAPGASPLVVIDAEVGVRNPMTATSGTQVLSPGGSLTAQENDDLLIEFDAPVQAAGIDVVFDAPDSASFTGVEFRGPGGEVLFSNSPIPSPTGAPGSQFVGYVADSPIIKSVYIDEFDPSAPDDHVAFDSLIFTEPALGPAVTGVTEFEIGDTTIDITFSEDLDPSTFGLEDISFTGPLGPQELVELVETNGSHDYRLTVGRITYEGQYTLTIGPNVADLGGNAMDQNGDNAAGDAFSTSRTLIDTESPFLVSLQPTASNSDVAEIDLTFSEPILAATFTAADVSIERPDGSTVLPASISIRQNDVDNFTIEIDPPLSAEGSHAVTVGPNITDLAGNAMSLGEVASADFTTNPTVPGGDWVAFGSAGWDSSGVMRVTPALSTRSGATYFGTPQTPAPFVVEFDFNFNNAAGLGGGADGLVFVVAENPVLGGAGVGIGYSGALGTSFAVEFDTYYNGGVDPNNNHLAVNWNGGFRPTAVPVNGPWMNNSGTHHATVRFDGTSLLSVTLVGPTDEVTTLSQNVPPEAIPSQYTFGFTSGTGGGWANHDIDNVSVRLLPDGASGEHGGVVTIDTTPPTLTDVTLSPASLVVDYFDAVGMAPAKVGDPDNYGLLASGGDGTFNDGNEITIDLASVAVHSSGEPVTFTFDPLLLDEVYELTLKSAELTDLAGSPLNGGIDIVQTLTLDAATATLDVDLQADSDTGISDTDNLTADSTPTFDVTVSEAGRIRVDYDGDGVFGDWQVLSTGGTFELTPDAELADELRDVAIQFEPVSESEIVTAELAVTIDTFGPAVVVENGAQAPWDNHGIVFSEPIQSATFDLNDVQLLDAAGNDISTDLRLLSGSGADYTISFDPQFTPGGYELRVGLEVVDLAGNLMNQDGDAVNGEASDSFAGTIDVVPDQEAPFVILQEPVGTLSSDISSVRIGFSELIDATTFTADDVLLTTPGGPIDSASITVTPILETTTFSPIDFSGEMNFRWQNIAAMAAIPVGEVQLGGVPFSIPTSGNNAWHAHHDSGANPRVVEISVDVPMATEVYTLLNAFWGETSPGTFASIEFIGSDGAFYAVDLDGDDHVRDWNEATWANNIVNAVEVWTSSSGKQHLDMQTFVLPADFHDETLQMIRIVDNGSDGVQRVGLTGLTVAATETLPHPRSFDIGFPNQSADGEYTIEVGPDVRDVAGNRMNQGALTEVFASDFETAANPALWNNTQREGSPSALETTTFSGRHGNNELLLTIDNLPVHRAVTLNWDLLILDSWDGNRSDAGPDFWGFEVFNNVSGQWETPFEFTFSQFDLSNGDSFPGLPDVGPTQLGFSSNYDDSIYRDLERTIDHSGDTLQVKFRGRNLQTLNDESWGLDNLTVTVNTGELGDGVYRGSFSIDKTGPQVIGMTPLGVVAAPIGQIDVTFDEPVALVPTADPGALIGPGGVITVNSLTQTADATFRVSFLPQTLLGDYTLIINPEAVTDLVGNLLNQDGDTNNGEAGEDGFTGSFTLIAPDLVIDDVTAPDAGTFGATIEVSWQGSNQGATATPDNWSDRIWLSTDDTFGNADDVLIGSATISGPVAVGETYTVSASVTLPIDLSVPIGAHAFQLFVEADGSGQVVEENDSNNVLLRGIQLTVPDGPAISSFQPSQDDGVIQFADVTFDRPIDASSFTRDDVTLEGPGGAVAVNSITSLGGDAYRVHFSQATAAGQYTMRIGPEVTDLLGHPMNQDDDSRNGEPLEDIFTAQFGINLPDLSVEGLAVPPSAKFGNEINVSWTVRNNGDESATANIRDRIWLSADGVFGNDILLGTFAAGGGIPLAAAGTYTKSVSVTLPLSAELEAGTYTIIVQTDALSDQSETAETNNLVAASSRLSFPPLADLVVSTISAPATAFSGQGIQVTWTLANQGDDAAAGTWNDVIYLSSDDQIGGDQSLGSFGFTGQIPAGGSVVRTQVVTLPDLISGNRWIVVAADSSDNIFEYPHEDNNLRIADSPLAIELRPFPNLQVTSVTPPSSAFSSQETVVEWVVTNSGNGATSAPIWYDGIWLSADALFDELDYFLGQVANSSYLNPGDSYVNSRTVTLPQGIDGDFYFVIKTDHNDRVFEFGGEGDNLTVAAPTDVELTPPPDLQVTNVNAPSQAFSGQQMSLSWTVTNEGSGGSRTVAWQDRVYMSEDNVLDGGDELLATVPHSGALDAGESYSPSVSVNLPIGVAGDFFFFVSTDVFDDVFEHVFEQNNEGFDETPVTINLTPPPDLEVDTVNAPANAVAGLPLTIDYTIANFGATGTPNSAWTDRLYFSVDTTFDPQSDQLMASRAHFGALDAFGSYSEAFTFKTPDTMQGEFFAFVATDATNEVFELVTDNNHGHGSQPVSVTFAPPDLTPTAFTAVDDALAGKPILVNWTVANIGAGKTSRTSWTDQIFLSGDTVLDGGDQSLLALGHGGGLESGQSYSVSNQLLEIPISVETGDYYLILRTDSTNVVFEHTADANNVSAAIPIHIERQTSEDPGGGGGGGQPLIADLQVTSVTAPASAESEDAITVSWTVENAGAASTNASWWKDSVYLSDDPVLEAGDHQLGTKLRSAPLDAGETYSVSQSYSLPFELSGNMYVIVYTDHTERVFEGDQESNNIAATGGQLDISLRETPDLVVSNVDAPTEAFSGQTFDVSWTVGNEGVGGTGNGSWVDSVYLSLDQVFDSRSDTFLGFETRPAALAPGGEYTQTASFSIPAGLSGPFYVFVSGDSGKRIFERGAQAELNNSDYDLTSMQVNLLPPADLVVGTITIPASGVPGRDATITYTVENQGTNAARGRWFDSLYVSADSQWDLDDPLFARQQHVGDINGGESYSETVTAPLPGVLPGDYQVILRSDIRNNIQESSDENNVGASLDTFVIDAAVLQLDVPENDALIAGQSSYYRIDLPAGETVRFSLDSVADDAAVELFVRRGNLPSRNEFDFAANQPFVPDPNLTVPVEGTDTYYVLVFASSTPAPSTYSLLAETVPFSLQSVASDTIGNLGRSTVRIDGARFSSSTQFHLVDIEGNAYAAADVVVDNSILAYATFDMSFIEPGVFSLHALDEGATSQLADAVTLIDGEGFEIITTVQGPDSVRPDRLYPFQVFYSNDGDSDAMAPLLVMESHSGTPIGARHDTLGDHDVHLFGLSPDGPIEVLRPGAISSLPFFFRSGTVADGVDIRVVPVDHADSRLLSDDDWDQIEQSVRPPDLEIGQWLSFWARLRPRIGTTWGDYVKFLNRLAIELSSSQEHSHDVSAMLEAMFQRDANYLPTTQVSGELRDADSGDALANVEVATFRLVTLPNGEQRREFAGLAETDESGQFTIPFLLPGEYEYGLPDTLIFDQDLDGEEDPLPPNFEMTGAADLDGGTLHVRVAPDNSFGSSDTQPQFVSDTTGVDHIFWMRDNQVWHAHHDGTSWVGAAPIPGAEGRHFSVYSADNVVDGTAAGLVVVWDGGAGLNESEIFYSVGQWNQQGDMVWAEPIAVSDDDVTDRQPVLVVTDDGQIVVAYLKADESQGIDDDSDLYYNVVAVDSSDLVFSAVPMPEIPPPGPALQTQAETEHSFSYGFDWNLKTPRLIKLGEASASASVSGSYQRDCSLNFSGQGQGKLTIAPSLFSSQDFSLSGKLGGRWAAEGTQGSCYYEHKETTLSVTGTGGINFNLPLERVVLALPPALSLPGVLILTWLRDQDIFSADAGLRFTGGVKGSVTWTRGVAPPLGYPLPDRGKISSTVTAGIYAKAMLKKYKVDISGEAGVTAEIIPNPHLDSLFGSVSVTIELPFGLSYTYTATESTPLDVNTFDAGLHTSALPPGVSLSFAYDPTLAKGTTNTYYDGVNNSILADLGSDIYGDNTPTMVKGPDGTIYAAWEKQISPIVGSSIMVSSFDGQDWSTAVEIPGSGGGSAAPDLMFDTNGNLMAIWSSLNSGPVSPDITEEEYVDVLNSSNVYYSLFDGTSWSLVQTLYGADGADEDTALGRAADGSLLATWLHYETSEDVLLSSMWDGSGWSAVTEIARGEFEGEATVGSQGGQTVVFWAEDLNADPQVTESAIMYSTFLGNWTTPTAFEPELAASASAFAFNGANEGLFVSAGSQGLMVSNLDLRTGFIASIAELPIATQYTVETVVAAYDSTGRPLVGWIQSAAGATDQTRDSEVVFAYFDEVADEWLPHVLHQATDRQIGNLHMVRGQWGHTMASWTERSNDGSDSLYATSWNDHAAFWSAPQRVAERVDPASVLFMEADDYVIITWEPSGDAEGEASQPTLLSEWSGQFWKPAVEIDAVIGDQTNVDRRVLDGRSAALLGMALARRTLHESRFNRNNRQLTPLFLLPTPPDDCCPCKKVVERTVGNDEGCGSRTEFDHERCLKITFYRPCVVRPIDPNDILGPEGFGEEHFVTAEELLDYMIRFENSTDANAPAQVVEITQTFDPDIDARRFRIGSFGFGSRVFEVPENRAFYTERFDLTEDLGIFIDFVAGVDLANNQAFWRLISVDPETGEPPLDAQLGFLPPNDENGAGEGFVTYSIQARSDAQTGDVIDAEARIIFDTEEPIDTPPIFNTLDAVTPTSAVDALPATVDDKTFNVTWSGADDEDGSGLTDFTVFVSTDDGPFEIWLDETLLTEAPYVGEEGTRYAFYSIARDNAGNVEQAPSEPQALTVTPGSVGNIGDFVWLDVDADGIQDAGEEGVAAVTVRLYLDDGTESGSLLDTTATDSDGLYGFAELDITRQYRLEFVAPEGLGLSPADEGSDDELDSDADVTGRTASFAISSGDNSQWDAGLVALGAIGGVLWHDVDGDTVRDEDEPPLVGWTVYVDANDNGQLDDGELQRQTDADGGYRFDDLFSGQYILAQELPAGWIQTYPGSNGATSTHGGFRSLVTFTGSTAELRAPGEPLDIGPVTAAADLVNLDDLRTDPLFAGVDGSGFSVVVIDTGIDLDHEFFGPDDDGDGIADRIVYQYDFADGDADASDVAGHGSHVSSIIVSQDGVYSGVAAGADLIHLKVFSDDGRGYFSYVEQALQWVIANASQYNVAAVNMSVGDGSNWTQSVGLYGLSDELAVLADMNVITVSAAGNSYALHGGQPGLAYPAADPNSLSVGAVWDADRGGPWPFSGFGTDYTTAADRVTGFSQRGGLLDAFAPGALITAANAVGGVATMRGTSMASPFVSGAVVLAQQVAGDQYGRRLTLAEVRLLLETSGHTIFDGDDEDDNVPNSQLAYSRLDVHALVNAVLQLPEMVDDHDTDSSGEDEDGSTGSLNARPFTYTLELATGQIREDVDFGDRFPPPIDVDGTNNIVPEDAADDTPVGITVAPAVSGTPPVTYSLIGDAQGRFTIDSDSGVVTVADGSLLDFEMTGEHTITVRMDDGGAGISTTDLTIAIGDVNEAPTDITLDNRSLAPQTPAAIVGRLTVQDPDHNDSHTFSVSDERFEVQDGLLQLKAGESLDPTVSPSFSLEVTATDAGTPPLSLTKSFTITTDWRLDFNGTGSPTAAGFIGVEAGTANAYTAAQGYGWQTASGTFDRFGPTDLLRDGHYGTDNTFLVDLANGNYIVNITLGDAAARDLVDVYVEGVQVLDNFTTAAGQYAHRSFPVTLSDGQLTLRFDDDGFDPFFSINAIEVLGSQLAHTLTPEGTGTTVIGSGATAGSLVTVSTSLGSIAGTTSDADPNHAGVQVIASPGGTFSFDITAPVVGGAATIISEEVTGRGIGSTTFAYAGLAPAVQICDNEDGCFSAATYTLRTTWGFQGDTRFAAGDNSGDTATWTFAVDPGFDYRVSAYWVHHPNRATNAPYKIFDGTTSGTSVGTASVNQKVPTTDVVYTRVLDSGVWFADLGGPYTISGGTLTVTLDDDANGYVIADAIRIERLPALRAETEILDAASTNVLTGETAAPLLDAGRVAWSLAEVSAAVRLSGVEVIVTDLPGKVLGLASEVSNTIWLDTNAAGHGWNTNPHSAIRNPQSVDLLSVISHELGHLLGLEDLDPTAHAGELMAARLSLGTRRLPLGGEALSLTTLDISQPADRQSTRLVDDLFSGGSWWASQARPTLQLHRLTAASRDPLIGQDRDSLLDGERDDSPLLDELAADRIRVPADRRLLSDLTGSERLEHERDLDELFADAEELFGMFDEKLLKE